MAPAVARSGSTYYTSSVPVPAGWGAAYDVFAPASLLASVDCTTLPNVHLIVGAENSATQRIWHTAYLSQDGNTWSPIALSQASPANPLLADGYFQSQAIATLTLTGADLSNKWNYIAFLVAYSSGPSWIYGCADTTCATPGWNLQAITIVPQLIISFVPSAREQVFMPLNGHRLSSRASLDRRARVGVLRRGAPDQRSRHRASLGENGARKREAL